MYIILLSVIVVFLLAAAFIFLHRRFEHIFWYMPLAIMPISFLSPKMGLADRAYAQPAIFLAAGLLLAIAFIYRQNLTRQKLYQLYTQAKQAIAPLLKQPIATLKEPSSASYTAVIACILLAWLICFVYGALVAIIRWQEVNIIEWLRNISYLVGLFIFAATYVMTRKLNQLSAVRAAWIYITGISLFAVIAIGRVARSVVNGHEIDYWLNSPHNQAVGFLGQYVDMAGLHVIPSAANENAGWLLSLGGFIVLALAYHYRQQGRYLALYLIAFCSLSTVMLFTLSRASLVLWYCSLVLLIIFLLRRWSSRAIATGMLVAATLAVITFFPDAPFVRKALNTVSVSQVATTPHQETQDSSPALAEAPEQSVQLELELEPSAQGRLDYWKQTLEVVRQDGLMSLIGQGEVDLRHEYDGLLPHSLLLQNLVLYGVIGLITFFITWLGLLYVAWGWLRRPHPTVKIIAMPLAAVIPGWLISNLIFGGSFLSIELLMVWFGLAGIVCATIDQDRASESATP